MKKALFIFTILLFSLASCDDPNEGELFVQPAEDASEMSITDVLESQPETYSMWIEFMKYANFYNALKNTDKATIFCPNNKAVQEFLAKRGVNSVQELDLEYAKNVVRTHIINEKSLTDSTINQAAKALTTIDNPTLFNSFLNLSYGYKITDVDDAEKNDVVYNTESIYCWMIWIINRSSFKITNINTFYHCVIIIIECNLNIFTCIIICDYHRITLCIYIFHTYIFVL